MIKAHPRKCAQESSVCREALVAKNFRAPWLVVIFHEARKVALLFRAAGEPGAHLLEIDVVHRVVERLVIGKRESEIEEPLLRTPIRFRQQHQVRHSGSRFGPEFPCGRLRSAEQTLPDAGKYIVELQHSHIAANAVTVARDDAQIRELRGTHLGTEMIQLRNVYPRREVRILSEGDVT